MSDASLRVEDVSIRYGRASAVRNVSFTVARGSTLGIVGESGSGKSSLGYAMMGLLPRSATVEGRILLGDTDLAAMTERQLRRIRGRRVGMVFQDSLASLNPVFTIGRQLTATLRHHHPELGRAAAIDRAGTMLEEMGIRRDRLAAYPHELSGGMRQRTMIAAALAADPDFLIADESTSDLDTVSQKQILELLARVQHERRLGLIVISHDLGVIRTMCAEVAVMYRGDLVEIGPTRRILTRPAHWYSRGLVAVSLKRRRPDGFLETLPSRATGAAA